MFGPEYYLPLKYTTARLGCSVALLVLPVHLRVIIEVSLKGRVKPITTSRTMLGISSTIQT